MKRDRTARLVRVGAILHQHPHGLTACELARRLGATVRTAYRDFHALEALVPLGGASSHPVRGPGED